MRVLLVFLLVCLPLQAYPSKVLERLQGHVIRVIDGDTFVLQTRLGQRTIRLAGVDCPETRRGRKLKGDCRRLGLSEAEIRRQGQEAKRAAERILHGCAASVEVVKVDRSGRRIGWVRLSGGSLNHRLVLEGWADLWLKQGPTPHHSELVQALQGARGARRGLWRHPAPALSEPH